MGGRRSAEEMCECTVCHAKVKESRLAGHMRNVHHSPRGSESVVRSDTSRKSKRLERRKAELERRRKNRVITAAICVLVVFAFALVIYMLRDDGGDVETIPIQTPSTQTDTTVKIAASDLGASAKFYSYTSNGINMRFFAVQGTNGEVHVALDACDVCYPEKKGYRQTGGVMKCNNCGKEFAITGIGTENQSGGCWPSYLPMDVQNGYIVVEKSILDGKRYMFQ